MAASQKHTTGELTTEQGVEVRQPIRPPKIAKDIRSTFLQGCTTTCITISLWDPLVKTPTVT